jgi:hypothetical protein
MIYWWQEPYIFALLETNKLKLRAQILETRAAFEQRLLSPVGAEELRAMEVAAAGLDALERRRPNTARRVSDIRSGRSSRARDLDI